MRLEDAVDELYAAAPADFVATRTRLAREAKGDDPDLAAAITALRKPTRTAWLLNRVARDEPQVVADLTALGERMRAAQAKGDGATLAQARPERRAAIDALVAAAGRCAEATGSPSVLPPGVRSTPRQSRCSPTSRAAAPSPPARCCGP